uniref:Ragulator complex protein LAMTOR1 n=1 Tax=Heterorhabditis bacteriophora TaxID=37862 RepID=A0A1I7XVG2_HETBA
MGCRLSRTDSSELSEKEEKETMIQEKRGHVTNGQAVLLRRDTPAQGLEIQRNGYSSHTLGISKPIGEVESASQADFFRMLDAKIAHGADLDSTSED